MALKKPVVLCVRLTLLTCPHITIEILPRSVLFARFESTDYLLCALGDGTLVHFSYQVQLRWLMLLFTPGMTPPPLLCSPLLRAPSHPLIPASRACVTSAN